MRVDTRCLPGAPLLCDGLPANVLHSSEELAMGSMLTEWMVGREQHINYWQYFFQKSGFGSRDNTFNIRFVPYEKLCINYEYFFWKLIMARSDTWTVVIFFLKGQNFWIVGHNILTVRREKLLIQHSIFDGTGLSWKVLATVEATDGNKYQT